MTWRHYWSFPSTWNPPAPINATTGAKSIFKNRHIFYGWFVSKQLSDSGRFPLLEAYFHVIENFDKFGWRKLVWGPLHVQTTSLIAWFVALNRLPSLEKISDWKEVTSNICGLCDDWQEGMRVVKLSSFPSNWNHCCKWMVRVASGNSCKAKLICCFGILYLVREILQVVSEGYFEYWGGEQEGTGLGAGLQWSQVGARLLKVLGFLLEFCLIPSHCL